MQGWLIFKHAVVMLWGNKAVAFRLGFVPLIIATISITAFVVLFSDLGLMQETLFGRSSSATQPQILPDQLGEFYTGILGFLLLSMIFTIWVIVAWHRFILLEEDPTGFVTPFNGDRILAYLGQILKLFLVGFLISLPFGAVFGLVLAVSPSTLIAGLFVLSAVFFAWLVLVFYRLSITLPASAIGRPISLREAWRATEGTWWVLFVLVLLAGLTQMLIQFVVSLLLVVPLLGFAVNLLISFAIGMLNASILTTLYGHYIEGRDL